MSKSNTNKKLITNNSSPYLIPQNKEKIKNPSPNPHPQTLNLSQKNITNDIDNSYGKNRSLPSFVMFLR